MMKTIFFQGQQWPTSQPIQYSKGEFIITFFAEYNNHVSFQIGRLRQTGFIIKDFRLLGLLISLRQLFQNPSQSIRQDIVGSCLPQNQNKQARIPQNGRLGHIFVYEAAGIYSKSEIDLQWYRQQPEWRQSSSSISSSLLSPLLKIYPQKPWY